MGFQIEWTASGNTTLDALTAVQVLIRARMNEYTITTIH